MKYPHREAPMRRKNPKGKVVWVARVTTPEGKRILYKPPSNGGKATFPYKNHAQEAIDEYYDLTYGKGLRTLNRTVGEYAKTWTKRHPRDRRTNETNEGRIRAILDVRLEDRKLRDWPFPELKRRHVYDLVDHMLTVQGRSRNGVRNVLASLSAMVEDAITDEDADVNPVKGVKIRKSDPRVQKADKQPRVFSFADMHSFCTALGPYEALGRAFSDLGLRLGEALPLSRSDLEKQGEGWVVCVRRTAHNGRTTPLTKREKLTGEETGGRVVPASEGFMESLARQPRRIDTQFLWPTPTGKLYWERNFYRDVWRPAVEKTGMDCTPHDFRHSWETRLHSAGIDPADLAEMAGHSMKTMRATYVHPLRQSYAKVRSVVG